MKPKNILARAAALTASVLCVGAILAASPALAAAPYVTSAKITGPNTVMLTFSNNVTTQAPDYYNLSGALSGRNITNVSGSGTNTITLTFDGAAFSADASGSIDLGTGIKNVSDGVSFGIGSVSVIDGQAPSLTNLNITSSANNPGGLLAKTGDTITLSFSANESLLSQNATIDGHSVYTSGSGSGPYTASYIKTSSDPQGQVTFAINMADQAGNNTPYITSTWNLNGGTTQTNNQTNTITTTTSTSNAPVIKQVASVPDQASGNTPSYTFTSDQNGTITFYGDCSSANKTAVSGSNTITFNALSDGLHNNCALMVTNSSNQTSNTLFISAFTVGNQSAAQTSASTASASQAQTSSSYQFTKLLKKGMSGDEVLALQNKLADLGYLKAKPNGYFGPATEAAVKAFQKDHGLDQFGYTGPGTRAELNK